MRWFGALYTLFLANNVCFTRSENVLGCGGYITSQFPLDYSKLQIGLYTSHGTLKDSTDCSPTGYFFIPVFSNGRYSIKISASPSGWEFMPEEVPVTVDGRNDICSRGDDVIFKFVGYRISGRVVNKEEASKEVAEEMEVDLVLFDASGNDVGHTKTGQEGNFFFKDVAPGKYVIKINEDSLSSYSFEKSEQAIKVADDAITCQDFVVLGFDVDGHVLFGDNGQYKVKDWKIIMHHALTDSILKSTTTDETGSFKFSNVSQGQYIIRPHLEDPHGNTIIKPTSCEISVANGNINSCKFIIIGQKFAGKIVHGHKETGLKGVTVHIKQNTNIFETETDSDGTFISQLLSAGLVNIIPSQSGLYFENNEYVIQSPKDNLPIIKPKKLLVLGHVKIVNELDNMNELFIQCQSDMITETATLLKNSFQMFLETGKYLCSVESRNKEHKEMFKSQTVNVDVRGSVAVPPITFKQSKLKVSGNVNCMEKVCLDVFVNLRRDQIIVETAEVTKNKFVFDDVKPGMYQMTISSERSICWETEILVVKATTKDIEDLHFVQHGILLSVSSDNPTILTLIGPADNKFVFNIDTGINKMCLQSSESFQLSTDSCYSFKMTPEFLEPLQRQDVKLVTTGHKVTGQIASISNIPDLKILVESGEEIKEVEFVEFSNGLFRFSLVNDIDGKVIIRPVSTEFFFEPAMVVVKSNGRCLDHDYVFNAKIGVYIYGLITPAVTGVRMATDIDIADVISGTDGSFKIGPLSSENSSLQMVPKKLGYFFKETKKHAHFEAYRLGSAVIHTMNKEFQLPAVISISGGSSFNTYRNNSQATDGKATFPSLYPGEYFVKPYMKEYIFEPRSIVLTINEVADINSPEELVSRFEGTRVAYSALGKLQHINGILEENISVLASGTDKCQNHSEDAISSSAGNFIIQGLKPGCVYVIGSGHAEETFLLGPNSISVSKDDITITRDVIAVKKNDVFNLAVLIKSDHMSEQALTLQLRNGELSRKDYTVVTNKVTFLAAVPKSDKTYNARVKDTSLFFDLGSDNFKYIEIKLPDTDNVSSEQQINQNKKIQYILPIVLVIPVGVFTRYMYLKYFKEL